MTSEQRGVSEQEIVDELKALFPMGRIPTDEEVACSIRLPGL